MLADRRGEVKVGVKGGLGGGDAATSKFAASSSKPAYIRIFEHAWSKMVLMFQDMLTYLPLMKELFSAAD